MRLRTLTGGAADTRTLASQGGGVVNRGHYRHRPAHATFTQQHTARATALTEETRPAFIESAEERFFEGQSKQEANKSRKSQQLRGLCYCLAEKLSYTMTMEQAFALLGKPSSPTAEEERVMRAVFDNCLQADVK